MKIERLGNFLAIKDNQNELKHLVPFNRIFVHKHPLKKDYLLISDRSKPSIKDAIQIKASDVDRIGKRYINKLHRGILFIYLALFLDESRAFIGTPNSVDGYLVEITDLKTIILDVDDLVEEPVHAFTAYDGQDPTIIVQGLPEQSTTFRITNGGLWGLFLENEEEENAFIYNGNQYTRYQIRFGRTVEVDFDVETGLFTITDI